ncbi:MAG: hypothetical protein OEY99_04030 [Aigarchaeota archaeon]|nr:hypothetical protein [Aigarchaeota archaeon]
MSKGSKKEKNNPPEEGRRDHLKTVGGLVAGLAIGGVAGWLGKPAVPGIRETVTRTETGTETLRQTATTTVSATPLGEIENNRVTFYKSELSIINESGVLLNLVATNGHTGIRFYKDFDFGNEKETNPWHMGYIEGLRGYQGLAILRDWLFTSALWDEDGKLIVGRLDPHPPANQPAKARFQVRGTVDEVQAIVEASRNQTADIFQAVSGEGTKNFSVNSSGNTVIGSPDDPKEIILHDTVDGRPYSLKVINGQLVLTQSQ